MPLTTDVVCSHIGALMANARTSHIPFSVAPRGLDKLDLPAVPLPVEDLDKLDHRHHDGCMSTLHITGDPEADALLSSDPLALLIGMLLDQQVC